MPLSRFHRVNPAPPPPVSEETWTSFHRKHGSRRPSRRHKEAPQRDFCERYPYICTFARVVDRHTTPPYQTCYHEEEVAIRKQQIKRAQRDVRSQKVRSLMGRVAGVLNPTSPDTRRKGRDEEEKEDEQSRHFGRVNSLILSRERLEGNVEGAHIVRV